MKMKKDDLKEVIINNGFGKYYKSVRQGNQSYCCLGKPWMNGASYVHGYSFAALLNQLLRCCRACSRQNCKYLHSRQSVLQAITR